MRLFLVSAIAAWLTSGIVAAEGPDVPPRQRVPLADGLAPEPAARAMTAPPGFSVRLLAAEPDVRQPIAMCFDDRGRLWVAEAYSYPRRVPPDEARDRILIFEDTDGDHTLDRRIVFQEGLNLVSGLEVGFGGVWVGAAPELLFIPDADGDDVPDAEPRVLLDGWGWQDTHETLNAFTWGPDGWLYGCHGVFTHSAVGRPGTPEGDRVKLNAGYWRYHPVRHEFEVFAEGTSNPWGIDFNEVGHAFSTACVIPHLYHVIQGARYQRQAGQHFNPWTFDDIKTIARHRHWVGGQWDQADRERSDAIGGGHAHAGACFYLGGTWPERFRGRLFMNNIHGARVNEDRVTPSGSGYVGDAEPDFLFANDAWSQFISLQLGPDGQMVILDWYDRNQCHHGDAAGHDRSNGRIFKVVYDRGQPVKVDLSGETDAALVGLLSHENDWFARHARRLLQERAAAGRLAEVTVPLLDARIVAGGPTPHRLRALWALHAAGGLDEPRILRLLDDADPLVRSWAIQLFAERRSMSPVLLDRCRDLAQRDPSPVVRLAVCSAVPRLPIASRWPLVEALVTHGEDAADHNLPLMIWYAVEPLVAVDPPRALGLAVACRIPLVSRFIVRRAAAEEATVESAIARLGEADSQTRGWMLEEIAAALAARGRMTAPQAWDRAYDAVVDDPDAAVRRLAEVVAVRFGDPRVYPLLRRRLADHRAPVAERLAALEAVVAARDAETVAVIHGLLDDPAVVTPSVAALASFPDEATPAALLAAYERLPHDAKQAAIATLVSRPAWTLDLLEAIAAGHVPRHDLSAFTVGRLAASADPAVLERLNEVWGTIRATPEGRLAEFETWRAALGPEAMKAADAGRGRAVFAKTCGSCHALHGEGGTIGPDLTGSNRADLDYLLANLLDPSGVVGRDYQMTTLVTADGRSLAGIVVQETPTSLALQTPTERVTVPLADVDERHLSTQSLMPENQLGQLSPEDARDLVAYLRRPTPP
jgi:putative membrane-bound dehydrogenase-like protein